MKANGRCSNEGTDKETPKLLLKDRCFARAAFYTFALNESPETPAFLSTRKCMCGGGGGEGEAKSKDSGGREKVAALKYCLCV